MLHFQYARRNSLGPCLYMYVFNILQLLSICLTGCARRGTTLRMRLLQTVRAGTEGSTLMLAFPTLPPSRHFDHAPYVHLTEAHVSTPPYPGRTYPIRQKLPLEVPPLPPSSTTHTRCNHKCRCYTSRVAPLRPASPLRRPAPIIECPVVWGGAAWATSLPPRSAGAAPRRAFSCMTPDIGTSLATPPVCFMGGYPETRRSSVAFVFSLLCPLARCKPSLPPSLCLCFLVFRSFVFSSLSELRAELGVPVLSHTCRAVSLQAYCPARLGSPCLRTRDLACNSVRR